MNKISERELKELTFRLEVCNLLSLTGCSIQDLLGEPFEDLRPRHKVHLILLERSHAHKKV